MTSHRKAVLPPALERDNPLVRRPSFRALVETFDFGMVVFDDQGQVTYASPLAAELAGATVEEIIGRNILEFADPAEIDYGLESLTFARNHPDEFRLPIEMHFGLPGKPQRLVELRTEDLGHDPRVRGTALLVRAVELERMVEDILASVMQGRHLDHTLQLIAELVQKELREGGVVITYEDDAGVRGCMAVNVPEEIAELPGPDLAGDEPLGVRFDRVDDLDEPVRTTATAAGLSGRWYVPMVAADGRRLGALTVWLSTETPPSPSESNVLRRLARTSAFGVDRWLRDRMLAHAASHDALTGLPNRRQFADVVDNTIATRRHPTGIDGPSDVVLYADLDGFKRVNDLHGHLVGDHLLVVVAQRLRAAVRDGDLLARLSGDEFAVLCRGASPASAALVAERMIEVVGADDLHVDGIRVAVGISVGIATIDPTADTSTAVVDRADGALRQAKAAGKARWRQA